MLRKISLLALICFLATAASAQDVPEGFKVWGSTGLDFRVSKKNTFSVNQLTAFNTRSFGYQFTQINLGYARKIGEQWNLDLGYAHSLFKSKDQIKHFNRVFTELDHKVKWGNLGMKNSVRAEFHFPQLRKWRTRYIISNKFSYRFKELPLRPQPFIRNQLYWYQGGRNVNYYAEGGDFDDEDLEGEEGEDEDEDFEDEVEEGQLGDLVVSQPANGFHRYRVTFGVRLRLAKRLYGTLFYTMQKEFNMPFGEYRGLNVPTPSGNIQAPFNNFNLIGFSLNYTLKLY